MRKAKLTAAYLLLFLLLSFGAYLGVTRLFAIREITVVGDHIRISIDQRRFPSTLLFFPSDEIRAELLERNPILADVRFEKRYPHTLVITPTLRSPVAVVATPSRTVLIDPRGYVLADADIIPAGLPRVIASISGIRIGQQLSDKGIGTSLSFAQNAKGFMNMETITIAGDGSITAHGGKLDILFTQNEDIQTILTTLQTLFTGFRIKGTLPTVIDLRFDKPIVKF